MRNSTLLKVAFVALLFAQVSYANNRLAIITDTSGSMEGEKLVAAKEGAKLAIALFDGNVSVIGFSSIAQKSPDVPLNTADSRRTAMRYVDRLISGGATNYVDALKKLKTLPKGTVTIFISDGENSEGNNADVLRLVRQAPGPIFTVAVDASGRAQKLLTEMAAVSGGAAVNIASAEDLTTTILKISLGLANYRSYEPHDEVLRFPGTSGIVIVLGYDSVPSVKGRPHLPEPPFQHRAKLPGEHVVLSRVHLNESTYLVIESIHKRTAQGRLARVLRNDLPRAVFQLNTQDGKVPAGGRIAGTIAFEDSQGRPIDPRGRNDLQAGIRVTDGNGHVVSEATAQPSNDKPVLEVVADAPNKPGPITVEQISSVTVAGKPFSKVDPQTLIVDKQKPIPLIAAPNRLIERAEAGRFQVQVTLRPDCKVAPKISFTAEAQSDSSELRLARATSHDFDLTLEFEASAARSYSGVVTVRGNANVPIQPVQIPFQFTVTPNYRGLALPTNAKSKSLGAFVANSGKVSFPPIEVRSLDDSPVPYSVTVTDFSDGSHVIDTTCTPQTVSPTVTGPVAVTLTANIGHVPVGVYSARIRYVLSATTPPRTWEMPLAVRVTEPLHIQPVDFGIVEAGGIGTAELSIKNAAPVALALQSGSANITAEGGLIEVTLPQSLPTIPAKGEGSFDVQIAVSPLVTSRGRLDGKIELVSSSQHKTSVPMRVTVVDAGAGPSKLVVSPDPVRLTAKAGQLVQFDVTIKTAAGVAQNDELKISVGQLQDAANSPTRSRPEFQWLGGNTVGRDVSARAKGFVIAPDRLGDYHTEITVESKYVGKKKVNLTLTVR